MKPDSGTRPLDVGGLNVTLTVSTSVSNEPLPSVSWNTWIVADVNAMSVMFSVQLGFGQSGAPGIGVTGGAVVVVIVTLPFLMSLLGTAVDPVTVTGAGLWPGGWFAPAGFVQVAVGFAVAVSTCCVSKFPRPA